MYLKPQNVQSWRFCSTVKGVEPKNMTGDNVLYIIIIIIFIEETFS